MAKVGERCTWEDIQQTFPEKWAVMAEPRLENESTIIDAVLIAVLDTVKKKGEHRVANADKGYWYRYTPEYHMTGGLINLDSGRVWVE